MESPSPCVHVQKLIFAVSLIQLELDLDQTAIVDLRQEALRECFDRRLLDRFNVRCRTPEFARVLSRASSDQHIDWLPVAAQRTVRKLRPAIAWNHLLDKYFFRLKPSTCLFVVRDELVHHVGAPCLRAGRVEESLFDRWLDRERQARRECGEVLHTPRIEGRGNRNVQPACEFVCSFLVPRPLDALPRRSRDSENLLQLTAK